MSTVAKKIMMGSGAVALPSDDQFNRVSFLSHFDGANNGVNNAFDDGSTSNHTITANGNVTQGSFGPFARPDGEWGVSFDGAAGDYLSIASSADFALGTGDFTVEFFVYHADLPSATTYFDYRSGQPQATLYLWLFGATGAIQLHINGTTRAFTPPSMLGRWAHIAIARSSGTTKTFVDGTQYLSFSDSTDYIQGSTFYISRFYGSDSENVNGAISNFRWIKGTAVYTSAFTAPTAPLTAVTNTKLLTCQSNRFVDNSASAHTVTPTGNPAVTSFGPFLTSKVYDPAVNGASSIGGYVAAAGSTDWQFGSGNFTVEFWTYPLGTGNWVIAHGDGSIAGTSISWQYGHGTFDFYYGSSYVQITSPTLTLNSWQYITVVRNGATITVYKDGVSSGTANIGSNTLNTGGTTPFYVGNYPDAGGGYINGYLSDVRVVKGTAVYTGNFTPPTAPLTAITNTKLLLKMADGQAIDSTSQNNLTLDDNTKISNGQAKFGDTSLLFDGTNDYATTIFKTSFGAGNFTIEYFFRVGSVSTNQNLFQFGGSFLPDDDGGPGLGIRTSRWRLYTGANTATHHGSAGPSNDTWYHIAVVRNGTTTKLYVDGVETISVSDSYDYSPRKHLLLGGGFDGSYDMNGYIDEFRVSHFARYTSNNFTVPSQPFADKGQ